MIKPLDDIGTIVKLIADAADLSEAEVHQNLVAESNGLGTNVIETMRANQIPHFVTSSKLDDFYENSAGFMYEITLWNACPFKQQMRDFVTSRLKKYKPDGADIFCFGDGLGFDSAAFAIEGYQLKYYEPSLKSRTFANTVFEKNEVEVQQLTSIDDITPASLDAIVCLDVLEHVPRPQDIVAIFDQWLKPDGLLFVHAPFWAIHWARPTHLKENRHLSGNLKDLYGVHGFEALDSIGLWNPIVLQKKEARPYKKTIGSRWRINAGRCVLKIAGWNCSFFMWAADRIAKPPKAWLTELRNYKPPQDG